MPIFAASMGILCSNVLPMSSAYHSIDNNVAVCYTGGMPDAKKLFVEALKAKLKETGLTQAELARRVGLTPRCINDILKGRRRGREETKERIARAFGMSYDEFLSYGRKIIETIPEPFPGFEEVMRLPASERFFRVFELAAAHCGFEGPIVHALGDPLFRDEVPVLETEEDVVKAYREYRAFWEERAQKLLELPGVDEERRQAAKKYLEEKFGVRIRLEDSEEG